MQLPDSLHPWHDWLSWFDIDLAQQVGELVRKLNPLLGCFQGQSLGGEPQPEGLEDLHRKGPYDRLLVSEWLLADELPDEFLRRAAGGEHLFLAPRPKARQAEKLIIALFDVGPLQLGGPRLAHLALWILLARRAREAGGELRWGILQEPPKLRDANTASDLKALLKGRSFCAANLEHEQAWERYIQEAALSAGECWLIGQGPFKPRRTTSVLSHGIQIRRSLDSAMLDIQLVNGSTPRSMQLALPAAAAGQRLLKGAFDSSTVESEHRSSPGRLALTLPPLLSHQGNHVAVHMLDEAGVVLFPIPKQGRKNAGKPKKQRWSSGGTPITAAFAGKSLGAVLSDESHLHFWQIKDMTVVSRPAHDKFLAPPGTASMLPAAWLRNNQSARLYTLDTAGNLVFWAASGNRPGPAAGTTHTLDTAVLGICQLDNETLTYGRREADALQIYQAGVVSKESHSVRLPPAPAEGKLLFSGSSLRAPHQHQCAVRMQTKPGEIWHLYKFGLISKLHSETNQLTLPPGWQGIGLVAGSTAATSGLLLLGPNRNALALQTADKTEALYMTASPIAKLSYCPVSNLVAMLTDDRELIVYSVTEQAVRLLIDSKASPSGN